MVSRLLAKACVALAVILVASGCGDGTTELRVLAQGSLSSNSQIEDGVEVIRTEERLQAVLATIDSLSGNAPDGGTSIDVDFSEHAVG